MLDNSLIDNERKVDIVYLIGGGGLILFQIE